MERRSFFKLAGFATAAVGAGFALSRCDIGGTAPSLVTPQDSAGDTIVGHTAVSFTAKVDVLIVGSGVAGMSAAMAPSEAGLQVMVADKSGLLGGEAYESSGLMYAAGTELQKKAGLTLSPEAAWETLKKELNNAGVKTLDFSRQLFLTATEWVDCLQSKYGAQFSDPSKYAKEGVNEYIVLPRNGLGDMEGVMVPFRDKLQAQGVMFQTDYQAKDFILDENAAVRGMRFFSEASKTTIDVRARRIVMATGGFASSQPLVQRHASSYTRVASYTYGSMGEGQAICSNAGGKLENMDGKLPLTSDLPQVPAWGFFAPVLAVDAAGRRFAREDDMNSLPEACFTQEGSCWWSIFDKGLSSCSQSRSLAQTTSKNSKRIVGPCDSVDALAQAMGVRTDVLEATFKRYEEAVDQGKDEDYGKTLNFSKLEAPYYAIRQHPVRYRTRGGASVDEKGRLLGTSGSAILNVYCCGSVTSCGGEGLSTNGAFGMLVGRNVVDDLQAAGEDAQTGDSDNMHTDDGEATIPLPKGE